MIPVLHNDGAVWLIGIVWNADTMAAFLAWWMPVNMVGYLVFLALFTWLDEEDGEWEPRVFKLSFILSMTLLFLPGVVVFLAALAAAYLLDARDKTKTQGVTE